MDNDTYVILRKGRNGHYSSVSTSMSRDKADDWLALLRVKKPGKYLLLNLRTNVIEEGKDSQGEPRGPIGRIENVARDTSWVISTSHADRYGRGRRRYRKRRSQSCPRHKLSVVHESASSRRYGRSNTCSKGRTTASGRFPIEQVIFRNCRARRPLLAAASHRLELVYHSRASASPRSARFAGR